MQSELSDDFSEYLNEQQSEKPPQIESEKSANHSRSEVLNNPLLLSILSGKPLGIQDQNNEKDLERLLNLLGKVADESLRFRLFLDKLLLHLFGELTTLVRDDLKYTQVLKLIFQSPKDCFNSFQSNLDHQAAFATSIAYSKSPLHALLTSENHVEIHNQTAVLKPIINTLFDLQNAKSSILSTLSSQIFKIAPNTCEVAGPFLTALLIGRAGSVFNLAKVPSCNLQALGGKRDKITGIAGYGVKNNFGEFGNHELVQNADEEDRPKLVKLIANAISKTIRIDAGGTRPDGFIGKEMMKDLVLRYEKSKAPKSGQMRKPLPIPDDGPKKRRGGRKFRRQKDKLALTEARLAKNQIKFGVAFDETVGGINGQELGMLAQTETGKLKIRKKEQKFNLSNKQKLRLKNEENKKQKKDILLIN